MNSNLLFDFTVDKSNKTITIKKSFDAQLPLVWKAWTTPELLDQWWGPQPWRTETKSMDFREGGTWLYAMVGPEGEKHWSFFNYEQIEIEHFFSGKDGFCDEHGLVNPAMPQNEWKNTFESQGGQTLVNMLLQFTKLEDLETIIQMGFQEGLTMGLNQLESLLPKLKN
jgi:uncharacterized protein YndB with AHSA1/START domain